MYPWRWVKDSSPKPTPVARCCVSSVLCQSCFPLFPEFCCLYFILVVLYFSWGRRKTVLSTNLIYLLGALTSLSFNSATFFVLGRVISGIGIGLSTCVVPVLLAEVAPSDRRGYITTLNQLEITIGILTSTIVGTYTMEIEHGWRWAIIIGLTPSLLQVCAQSYIPESPRYLVRNGRGAEALELVTSLRAPEQSHQVRAILLPVLSMPSEELISVIFAVTGRRRDQCHDRGLTLNPFN